MSNDSEKVNKIWKIVAYLVHLAFHLAARTLLFVLLVSVLIFVPILILIVWAWTPELLNYLRNYLKDNQIITIITLLASAGLLSSLLQKSVKDIWKSLLNVIERIIKVFGGRCLPKLDIEESLLGPWKHYSAKIWSSLVEARKLFLALSILWFILSLTYVIQEADTDRKKATKKWRENVTTKLDSIKKEIADHSHPDSNIIQPESSTSYLFEKGTVFSLVYEEGDLETKKGICPEDSNQVEWLKLFKATISDSPKDKGGHIKLKIQGFASVAPVRVNNDTTLSNTLNCQIANERAEALIYFLTLPDSISYDPEICKDDLDDGHRWGRMEKGLYTHTMPDTSVWRKMGFDVTYELRQSHTRTMPDTVVVWKGQNFDVAYKPWQSYKDMADNKPEKGNSPQSRQRDIEFRNRSVQIIIEEGSDQIETMPAPPAEDNTG